jgi:hypothetical protein
MSIKSLLTTTGALLGLLPAEQARALVQSIWSAPSALSTLLVMGSIGGFFTNLYNDLTAFALAMATFFFAWAALLYMTANQNENHRVQARSALYVALGGLALAILAQTIAGLVNGAANGQ